jgi:hypothetical protein
MNINTKQHFSPGPWRVGSSNFGSAFYVIFAKDDSSDSDREVQIVEMNYGPHPIKDHLKRIQANATLIASAPELLEALQQLYKMTHDLLGGENAPDHGEAPEFAKARKAIRKALLIRNK